MYDHKPIRVNRRRKKNTILPVLALIAVALLLSLAIAGIWQLVGGTSEEKGSSSQRVSEAQSGEESMLSETTSVSSTASIPPAASEPPELPVPPAMEGAVPASARVSNDYFKDAVFVGDSITTGIELYGVMADTKVLAGTGINLASIYTSEVIKQDEDTRITIMDGLKQDSYKKVYVMLGGNEVRDEDKETFITRYGKVIADIKLIQPDALIYIQSILPVTKENQYQVENPRIDEFNAALQTLCKEKDVYYLNVAETMKNEEGMLPTEASPADGMHFGPVYYNKWFEYLKTHTAVQ